MKNTEYAWSLTSAAAKKMKRQKGEDTTSQKDKNNTTLILWICAASFLGNSLNFLQFIESSNVFPDKLVCFREY